MLFIAVCEDMIVECMNLSKQIHNILTAMGEDVVIKQFLSAEELLNSGEVFDILFLDIKMPGMNGINLAEHLREKGNEGLLIFVTAIANYVFDAYDVEAFQYLLKPVSLEKLQGVLQRAVRKLQGGKQKEFLLVSNHNQMRKIPLKDIVYIESFGRKVIIYGIADKVEYYEQISILEKKLKGKNFVRCHKSYLIHLNYVDTFDKKNICMENGVRIPLAKRRYDIFHKEFMAYLKREGGMV